MAGLVGFNDIRNATMHALQNDPQASEWAKNHPETIKLAEFLMPGTPWSVGFGLMGVGSKDLFQIANNVRTGQNDPFANVKNPLNVGVFRDAGAMQKVWAEWSTGRSHGNLSYPGL